MTERRLPTMERRLPTMERRLRLGIAGLGNVGSALMAALAVPQADSILPDLELVAVGGRDPLVLARRLSAAGCSAAAVALDQLAGGAQALDVIVECLHPVAAVPVIEQGLASGATTVVLSASALLTAPHLLDDARAGPGRLLVATGAILGLDVLRAAAVGRIERVLVRTRKRPRSLADAPLVVQRGIDLSKLTTALCLFEGSANEAVRAFPQNVNVAAAISLAGIGADRTRVEIWADPTVDRNTHEVQIDSDCASVTMSIANHPSPTNPRTSAITFNSLVAALRGLTERVRIGS